MFGVASMTAPLQKVAVMKPGMSLITADPEKWHYDPLFDPDKVAGIHNDFVQMLQKSGAEVLWMPEDDRGIADAVFTYDASLMTMAGAILMSLGKTLRSGEEAIHREFYKAHNIPVIGEITGQARAEAGDTLWLDERTLVIGRGFRTNQAGVEQLKDIVIPLGVDVHVFDLPVFSGKAACLHLMSLLSLVDTYSALVCLPLLPVGLFELLENKGFSMIEAPYTEFLSSNTLSTNILATAPGECIMLDSLPQTYSALVRNGINVQVFQGDALCIGCEGGPTCLTRPLLRSSG